MDNQTQTTTVELDTVAEDLSLEQLENASAGSHGSGAGGGKVGMQDLRFTHPLPTA